MGALGGLGKNASYPRYGRNQHGIGDTCFHSRNHYLLRASAWGACGSESGGYHFGPVDLEWRSFLDRGRRLTMEDTFSCLKP
jgi:hypothetical protein